MRLDWLKSLRSSWKSLRQPRSRRSRRQPQLPVTIEQLEPLLLLTDVYIYAGSGHSGGGVGSNQDIVEGDSVFITMMSAGMDNGPATLHYRIENLDRGLDGTTYENDFDGTISFSGPMQGAQLTIPTIDNTFDELARHFRVSFAPGVGMGAVNLSVLNVTVHDNDFDTAILDRFLHHAEIIQITGKSYRLHHAGSLATDPAQAAAPKPAKLPTGSEEKSPRSKRSTKPSELPSAVTK